MEVNILQSKNTEKLLYCRKQETVKNFKELYELMLKYKSNKEKNDSLMYNFMVMDSKRHLKEFAIGRTGIVLDIDDVEVGSFQDVEAELKERGLGYVMYHTHNDGKNDLERFRVILILDKMVLEEDFQLAIPELKKNFKHWNIDLSTFSVCRRFVTAPANTPLTDRTPLIHYSKGLLFNIDKFVKEGKIKKKCESRYNNNLDEFKFENNKNIEGLKKYISKIKWVNGDKHNTLVRLFYKFSNDGYTFNEIKSAVQSQVSFKIEWHLLKNIK